MCQNQLSLPGVIRPCFANCDLCGERMQYDEIASIPLVFPEWEYIDEHGEPQTHPAALVQAIVCFDCIAFGTFEHCGQCSAEVETTDTDYTAICDGDDEPSTVCAICFNRCVSCEHCRESTFTNWGDRNTALCRTCRAEHYFCCDDCAYIVHNDAATGVAGDRTICDSCAAHYYCCEGCGDIVHESDIHNRRDAYYCESCDSPEDRAIYSRRAGRTINGIACAETANHARYFGVELEFSAHNYSAFENLCDETGWGACEDGSVAQEIKSPKLSGAAGIESCRAVCALARRHGLEVDNHCGYHLHIDLSQERELALARLACAYQVFLPVWKLFVPESRRTNGYCAHDVTNGSADELARGLKKPYKEYGSRYCAINWQAYRSHGTVEIRLHSGTAHADKVCNWISAHLSFVEHFRRVPFAQLLSLSNGSIDNRWEYLADSVFAPNIVRYYRNRAMEFGTTLPNFEREAVCLA